MLTSNRRGRILEAIVLLTSAAILLAPMYYSQVLSGGFNDINAHLNWAKKLLTAAQEVPSNVIAHGAWE